MEKVNKSVLKVSIIVIAISISIILVAFGFAKPVCDENKDYWILQSYGNSVALINGENVVEVYSSIVLDTLPIEDKKMLDNGISFLTKEEAIMAIEDYDG